MVVEPWRTHIPAITLQKIHSAGNNELDKKEVDMSNTSKAVKPKFRKDSELSFEQRTDPDYRLKQLEKLNGDKFPIMCSKCHHCR